MDYKLYDDFNDARGYDLFITPDGKFFRIKKRLDKSKITHEDWAEEYLKMNDFNINMSKFQTSIIFRMANLKTATAKAIHCLGFVYYSHDHQYYKPIIELPNPKVYGNSATDDQLDALYEIMMMNNENTNIPIFEGKTLCYVGMNDEVDYEEDRNKRIK